jgi:hypothetical protein
MDAIEPTLWGMHESAAEPQTPAHLDPAKCGTNHTNYTYGCRCNKCMTFRRLDKQRMRRGTLDAFTSQGITDYLARSQA